MQGRSKGVVGSEPGTRAEQAANAPGEGDTARRNARKFSLRLVDLLVLVCYNLKRPDKSGFGGGPENEYEFCKTGCIHIF